jgi:lysophospholipase L1-like esterase
VVFFGDSITESWASTAPAFFEGRPYLVRGIGGQTTAQMLVRFRQDVIALRPQAVVILAGTNDIAGNTGPYRQEDTFGHLKSMVELAGAHGIRVVLASILPARDYPWSPGLKPARKIIALNTLLRAYAEQNGLVYLDYHAAMADPDGGLKASLGEDGVHPNRAGYDLMGPLAERALQKALAAR